MNKLDWSIQIYTDKDGYRPCPGNDCGKPWDVYPADPVEPRDGQRRILLDGTKFKADIEDPDWSLKKHDFALQSGFGFVTKGSLNESGSAYQQMAQMYGYRKMCRHKRLMVGLKSYQGR
jgi:hypothetical protein